MNIHGVEVDYPQSISKDAATDLVDRIKLLNPNLKKMIIDKNYISDQELDDLEFEVSSSNTPTVRDVIKELEKLPPDLPYKQYWAGLLVEFNPKFNASRDEVTVTSSLNATE